MNRNILYLGSKSGTSLHRANELIRKGINVDLIDTSTIISRSEYSSFLINKINYLIGPSVFEKIVLRKLKKLILGKNYHLVWVDGGELFGPKCVKFLAEIGLQVINYNHDDPYGSRDKGRFKLFRKSIPYYDYLVVPRKVNINEAVTFGAKKIILSRWAADLISHNRCKYSEFDAEKWGSDVLFIGTWMPERGAFLLRLIELGIPVKFYGNSWHKATEWRKLKEYWGGGPLYGIDYVKAIQYSKITLCLLSKGNRDTATTRTAEIPFIGGLLCAERTEEHELLFSENIEAIFWRTPEECAFKCKWILNNIEIGKKIADAGHKRVIANKMTNSYVIDEILDEISFYD